MARSHAPLIPATVGTQIERPASLLDVRRTNRTHIDVRHLGPGSRRDERNVGSF